MGLSINSGGNNKGWILIAPADWQINYINKGNNNESPSFLVTSEKGNPQFNISGFNQGKQDPTVGLLEVSVDAKKQHKLIGIQDVLQGTTQDVLQGTTQDVYQGDGKYIYAPIFERTTNSITGTVTSYLGNNAGGKFGNGMVWLAINVEKVKTDGYTFGIASSGPANTYLGYDYNININDNQLVLSFDDKFISSAETAVKVYSTIPNSHDNSGHIPS
jgi:hypothetical protein